MEPFRIEEVISQLKEALPKDYIFTKQGEDHIEVKKDTDVIFMLVVLRSKIMVEALVNVIVDGTERKTWELLPLVSSVERVVEIIGPKRGPYDYYD